jgi:hypothetical protein
MKELRILLAMVFVLSIVSASNALAQRGMKWRGSSGWGPGGQYQKMYNPKTVERVTGLVKRVDEIMPMKGMSYGVHLLLKNDSGEVAVHLGPAWYVTNQDLSIKVGDKVEVTGSKVMFEGKPAIIAAQVKKGDEVLTLRDDNGFPMWSGWRRR